MRPLWLGWLLLFLRFRFFLFLLWVGISGRILCDFYLIALELPNGDYRASLRCLDFYQAFFLQAAYASAYNSIRQRRVVFQYPAAACNKLPTHYVPATPNSVFRICGRYEVNEE